MVREFQVLKRRPLHREEVAASDPCGMLPGEFPEDRLRANADKPLILQRPDFPRKTEKPVKNQ
jgi:hypothetical protein